MFKFEIKTAQFQKIEAKIRQDVNDILAAPAVLNEVGSMLTDRIKYQARVGDPLNSAGAFPELRPATKKHRQYLEKYNETHSTFKFNRSNLTVIGALLDSLTHMIQGPGKLLIYFKGNHPRYRGKDGPIGKTVANEDLAKWLKIKGFRVFDKSLADNETINNRIKSIVLRYLRRGLKVRSKLG